MLFSFRRYWALTRKELQQLKRAPKLVIQLTIPPTILLVLWGFAINPEVNDLPTAIVDLDRSPASRELLTRVSELDAFEIKQELTSVKALERAFADREIQVGLVIPPNFARDLAARRTTQVQVLIDAVTANSAGVAAGYLRLAIGAHNRDLVQRALPVAFEAGRPRIGPAEIDAAALFNPGLIMSWFYVSAIMAVVLFVDGSLVASAIAVREKETGTLEQLLMSPGQSLEILLAKTTPVMVLLLVGLFTSTMMASLIFQLPMRGSVTLYIVAGVIAALAAMGLGILLGTYSRNQQQAQFLTFFLNPWVMLVSGAFARIENMPTPLQWLSWVDPLRYLVEIIRGITIRGVGLDLLWRQFAALIGLTVLLYAWSALRFRRQVS